MKKVNLIPILIFASIIYACDMLDTSDSPPTPKYKLETNKSVYAANDTVGTSFINRTTDPIFLHYQVCEIIDLQKLEDDTWKSIPIPTYCTAEVKDPIKVTPGEKIKTGIALSIFDENILGGIYQFEVLISKEKEGKRKELYSNNFKIEQ